MRKIFSKQMFFHIIQSKFEDNSQFTKEKQDKYKKKEAAELPVWPTMKMEMDELKLALGVEG